MSECLQEQIDVQTDKRYVNLLSCLVLASIFALHGPGLDVTALTCIL